MSADHEPEPTAPEVQKSGAALDLETQELMQARAIDQQDAEDEAGGATAGQEQSPGVAQPEHLSKGETNSGFSWADASAQAAQARLEQTTQRLSARSGEETGQQEPRSIATAGPLKESDAPAVPLPSDEEPLIKEFPTAGQRLGEVAKEKGVEIVQNATEAVLAYSGHHEQAEIVGNLPPGYIDDLQQNVNSVAQRVSQLAGPTAERLGLVNVDPGEEHQ